MNSETVITAIRRGDPSVLQQPPLADASLVDGLGAAMGEFDERSQMLATSYLSRVDDLASANLLLRLTGMSSLSVAAGAARALGQLKVTPAVDDVFAAVPQRRDSFIRGQLYLLIGRSGGSGTLDRLRSLIPSEQDIDARLDLLAALTRLGGDNERAIFLKRVASVGADQALRTQDHLLYVGDPRLARGMLPWFDSSDGVMRIGSDRQGGMARMRDIAVWTAHLLGVKFPIDPPYLGNYSDAILAGAKRAIQALPE